jgi:hypothetical protein
MQDVTNNGKAMSKFRGGGWTLKMLWKLYPTNINAKCKPKFWMEQNANLKFERLPTKFQMGTHTIIMVLQLPLHFIIVLHIPMMYL